MNALAADDPYTTAFEARIEEIEGRTLVLDRTYFYAESGGQPADRGTVGGVSVTDVQRRDGRIVHTLAEEPDLVSGETVACRVDPAFRTYCMRTHTASHVLYGVARRLLDDLGYGGFDIDERKARIDFETSTANDDEGLTDLEARANRAVWESRPVSWETVPVAEARAREEVVFNTKTEEGVFDEGEGVRIVTVGPPSDVGDGPTESTNLDEAACGGTHVANTREIGFISVLDRSNPGEGLTRIELAVGPAAIEHRAETRTAALSAAREAGVGIGDLPDAIERQRATIEELEREREQLLNRVADAQIDALRGEPIECAGERWLVGALSGLDGEVLADRARELAGKECDVAALVADERPATVVVASAGETDASSVVDSLTSEFGGGGGGPAFAQGGGIDADPTDLVAALRSH
ncbi:MAG: alanyl-tRNA editing protein [Halalkalicoccus sp.]